LTLTTNPSKRDRVAIMTNVGSGMPGNRGKKTLTHRPDSETPIEDTLSAFDTLLRAHFAISASAQGSAA
jgi:hypothetical protein